MQNPQNQQTAQATQTTRRKFLELMGGAVALGSMGFTFDDNMPRKKPLNIMFITADDLSCDNLGCYGGSIKDLTPHLDKLAKQGMRFEQAHVNVGICMPSRIALATGLYGHNSGAMGFMHARPGTPDVTTPTRPRPRTARSDAMPRSRTGARRLRSASTSLNRQGARLRFVAVLPQVFHEGRAAGADIRVIAAAAL